jgi:hypothetical protein
MDSHPARQQRSARTPSAIARVALATCVLLMSANAIARGGDAESFVVELASGLTFDGILAERSLRVESRLGPFDVSADELQALVGRRPHRARQAVFTRGGDVLVGKLAAESLHFTTGDGKSIEVKLSQINRLTRRVTAAPATMPVPASAVVHSLDGDRIAVGGLDVLAFRTRWGALTFRFDQVYEIAFDPQRQAAHRIVMTDGSSLSGLLAGESLIVQPKGHTGALKIPIGMLARLEVSPSACVGAAGPRLDLVGGDVLRGALQGALTLQTELGPLRIAAGEIQKITPVSGSSVESAIALTDGRTITGSPAETETVCRLDCGASVSVPVEMIAGYVKSAPGSVRLAAAPDRAAGLGVIPGTDGSEAMLTIDQTDGMRCWRVVQHRYLYFAIDNALRPWPGGVTEIEMEYVDQGSGDIRIEYDSTDPAAAFNGAYKVHADVIQRADSGRLKTAVYRITDARFTGAQNLHADFRIVHAGDDFLVRTMRIRRGD